MVFKSLKEISVNEILQNKFQIKDISKPLQPNLRVPINRFFAAINFNYETDQNSLTLHRKSKWFNHVIIFILISNVLRNLAYILMNSTDQLFRLFCGDLIQFILKEVSYVAITFVGITSYATAMFCLFHYSSVNQLKWLNIFNAIQGKQSFVKNKILMTKLAKKFIRICLIFITFSVTSIYFITISAFSIFIIISFSRLSIKLFLLYALPWSIINTIWAFYCWGYVLLTLLITIICYYYKLRLHQLDIYAYWLSKQHFNHFNQMNYQTIKI